MSGEKTFVKITNREIYAKLLEIETQMHQIKRKTAIATWTGATALTIVLLILGSLIFGG